jgi:hypothetical protein
MIEVAGPRGGAQQLKKEMAYSNGGASRGGRRQAGDSGTERRRCGRTRAVLGGQRSTLGAETEGERQSGVGESSMAVVGRGGNGLLLQTDSERIRRTGRWLHALHVEAGR